MCFLCDFDSSSSRLLSSVSSTTTPPVCVRAKCIIVERSRMNVMYSQSRSNYTCEHDRYRGRWVMPIISEYCSLKRSEYDRWIGSRFLMHKRRPSSSESFLTARVWRERGHHEGSSLLFAFAILIIFALIKLISTQLSAALPPCFLESLVHSSSNIYFTNYWELALRWMGLEPVRLGYHINYDGWMFEDSEIDEERAFLAIKIIWLRTQRGKKEIYERRRANGQIESVRGYLRASGWAFFSFFYFALKERKDIQIISLKPELLSRIKRLFFCSRSFLFSFQLVNDDRSTALVDVNYLTKRGVEWILRVLRRRISLDIWGEVWNEKQIIFQLQDGLRSLRNEFSTSCIFLARINISLRLKVKTKSGRSIAGGFLRRIGQQEEEERTKWLNSIRQHKREKRTGSFACPFIHRWFCQWNK